MKNVDRMIESRLGGGNSVSLIEEYVENAKEFSVLVRVLLGCSNNLQLTSLKYPRDKRYYISDASNNLKYQVDELLTQKQGEVVLPDNLPAPKVPENIVGYLNNIKDAVGSYDAIESDIGVKKVLADIVSSLNRTLTNLKES